MFKPFPYDGQWCLRWWVVEIMVVLQIFTLKKQTSWWKGPTNASMHMIACQAKDYPQVWLLHSLLQSLLHRFDCYTGPDIDSICTADGTWAPYPTCEVMPMMVMLMLMLRLLMLMAMVMLQWVLGRLARDPGWLRWLPRTSWFVNWNYYAWFVNWCILVFVCKLKSLLSGCKSKLLQLVCKLILLVFVC